MYIVSTNPAKQKKCRSAKKLNFMSLEPEDPTILNTLEQFAEYNSAQVLIKQTRRHNYIVFLPIFLNTVKIAVKEGRYSITNNKNTILNAHQLMQYKLLTGDMVAHIGKYNIMVTMDLVYGPKETQIVKNHAVDILGACVNSKGELAINADPEVMVWVERICQIHENTHNICITSGCYFTFDKNLPKDVPYTCIVCGVTQCPSCKTEWEPHKSKSCILFIVKDIEDAFIKKQLCEGEIQPCPKCHTLTHKTGGCNKIICEARHCGEYWCWGCGLGNLRSKYTNPYDHWFKKECQTYKQLFVKDAESEQLIKQAIQARNLVTFGNTILD